MKKLIILLFFLNFYVNAQDVSSFNNRLKDLRNKHSNAFNERKIENLNSKRTGINRDCETLLKDYNDFIILKGLQDNKEILKLKFEIEEFYSFTSRDEGFCYCLSLFNKFIKDMGGYPKAVFIKEGVKFYKVDIGNFTLYYCFAADYNYKQYLIDINLSLQSNYNPELKIYLSKSSSKKSLGIEREVEIFLIIPKEERWTFNSIKIKKNDIHSNIKLDYCDEINIR